MKSTSEDFSTSRYAESPVVKISSESLNKLRKIAPMWASVLRGDLEIRYEHLRLAIVDGMMLDMTNSHRCIVGEAHYFSDAYMDPRVRAHGDHCVECRQFSLWFGRLVNSPSNAVFNRLVDEFYDHVLIWHLHLIREKASNGS